MQTIKNVNKKYILALNSLSKEFIKYKIDESEFKIGFRKIMEEWKKELDVYKSNKYDY